MTAAIHPFTRPLALEDYLPFKAQAVDACEALAIAAQAILDGNSILVRPLPLGRYELRCRDAEWLRRQVESVG